MAGKVELWSFVETCQWAKTAEEIGTAFLAEMTRLGFAHVALCSHVDPIRPPPGAVAIFRYPTVWLEHFSAEAYQRYDPVFMEATRRGTPFQWSDPTFLTRLNQNQQKVLNEGAEVGIANGVTIPIRGPDALPASCSLVPGEDGVDPENFATAHMMAVMAHENARRLRAADLTSSVPELSDRERRCLILVAQGKSDWTISTVLGISERSVKRTMERLKAKLGVATRTQAFVRAVLAGQISLYDAS